MKPKLIKNTIKLVLALVVVAVVIPLAFHTQTLSQNFKMFTDCLDSFGGRDFSTNFLERIGSGSQPGVVGTSQGPSFLGFQGYVNTAALSKIGLFISFPFCEDLKIKEEKKKCNSKNER